MTEFTKTKMHFALALLGTMFALHPYIEKVQYLGFEYPIYNLDGELTKVKVENLYVFGGVAGLLAFSVYCYAVALMSERPSSRMERLGNLSYAFAILIVPLYGALYGSVELAERFGQAHIAFIAPALAIGLPVLWLLFSYLLARRLRRADNEAKIRSLVEQEILALNRASEMFESSHFDLAVIEAWKALEARLKRVLLLRGYTGKLDTPQAMISKATRAGIVKDEAVKLLQEVRRQWNIAVGTEPLTKEAAESALTAARHILSTIPVEDPHKPPTV